MNVKFKEVKLNNFLSFESATFSLDDRGFVSIRGINNSSQDGAGSNGSGKSSVLEAIVWAITGETIRGTKDVVRLGTDACCVEITFECDSHTYRIARTKEGSSSIYFFVDGEDKSGKGVRDTEKIISDYLPELTHDLLQSVIVLGQGLPNRFTNNTPSGRKEILEKLTKSDFMLQDLKQRVSDRKEQLAKDHLDCEFEERSISEAIEFYNRRKDEIAKSFEELKLAEESLLNKNEYEDKLKSLKDDLSSCKLKIESHEKEISDIRSKYEAINRNYGETIDAINAEKEKNLFDLRESKNKLMVEITTLEKIISDKEKVSDICPTCGQRILGVVKPSTEKDIEKLVSLRVNYSTVAGSIYLVEKEYNRKLSAFKEDTESLISHMTGDINNLNEFIERLKKDRDSIESSVRETERYLIELETLDKSISDRRKNLEKELSSIEKSIEESNNKREENNKRIEDIKARQAIVAKMNTIVTRDFRGVLLGNVIDYLDRRAKTFCVSIFGNDSIKVYQEGNNLNISFGNKLYESLSGGEQKKIDIIIQFAIRDLLCNYMNFSCNFLAIDEIFDSLDMIGCQKVVEFITSELSDIQTVFIITHRQDLQVPCDEEIEIVKNSEGISSVQ